MKIGFVFILLTCLVQFNTAFCQNDDEFQLSDTHLLLIEEYLESTDGENTIGFIEIYDHLNDVYLNKLDINSLKIEDLFEIQLLTDIQINNYFKYRNNYGPFLSIYELQAIPLFDLKTISRILPFLSISESSKSFQPLERIKRARHEILVRTQRTLQTLAGSIEENGFLGDPYRHFFRYRISDGQNFKAGILAEKDVGEEFFKGSNKNGFDFYSYYLSITDMSQSVKHLVLGDYTVSMGQGLILHNQFGRGLSSFTTNIKKSSGSFRNYTSRNEVNYFKGAGLELSLSDYLTANIFASKNNIDGTLRDQDNDGLFSSFSSIDMSGNHRTEREISKKNKIERASLGGILKYQNRSAKVAINFLSDNFDKTFERTLRPDNIFFTRQKNYTNLSIDYGYLWRSVNLFGESAYSNAGGTAHIMGALLSIHPKLDLSLIYRNYSPKYISITPNSFGQGTATNNEKGVYIGIEFRPHKDWIVNAYADHWANPWLKFLVDSPSNGSDYLLKITYYKKRKYHAYFLLKTETKPRNSRVESVVDFTVPQRLTKLRLHFSNKINTSLELRNRVEFSNFENDLEYHNGFLLYQDILFKPREIPFSFTTRLMYFDIADFDARIYTYENSILNDFFVPSFSGMGLRYYFNLRYKLNRATMELRWAQTKYSDRNTISSGLTEINGNVITDVKAQVRLRF